MLTEDHYGFKYKSIAELAQFWRIPVRTLQYRLSRGWNKDIALTFVPRVFDSYWVDPIGEVHSSLKDMCYVWGIPIEDYIRRVHLEKWSSRKALITGSPRLKCFGLYGEPYPSFTALCHNYNADPKLVYGALVNGGTLDAALINGMSDLTDDNVNC